MASQWPGQPSGDDLPDRTPAQSPPGHGEPMPPQPPSGQPLHGEPMPPQPPSGQPLHGEPMPPQPPPGQPLHGQPLRRQPPSGKPPRKQSPPRAPGSDHRFAMVLLSIVGVVVVLGVGGCAVLSVVVNHSVDKASSTLKEGLRKAQNRNSITDEQAKAIGVGDDRDEIVRRFGPPAFGPAKEPALPAGVRDCISWHMRDGRIGSTWELCFRAGKLVEKQSDLSPSPRRRRPPPKAVPSREQ